MQAPSDSDEGEDSHLESNPLVEVEHHTNRKEKGGKVGNDDGSALKSF